MSRYTYLIPVLLTLILASRTGAQQFNPALRLELRGAVRADASAMEQSVRERGFTRAHPSREASLRGAVLDAASTQGFAFARIDSVSWRWSSDSASVIATVFVVEGPLVLVGEITFAGSAGLSEEILRGEMDTQPGAVFRDAALNGDLRRFVAMHDAAGYPFAEARVEDVSLREQSDATSNIPAASNIPTNPEAPGTDEHTPRDILADVSIVISEGPLFFIDEITVEGNDLTDADVIARETRFGEHERYDPEKMSDIRRRLERLQFFSRVDEPQLYLRDTVGGVLLRVAEGSTNQFDGVVGYQPPRGSEERGSVTGLVNLSLRNIFGTGRRLDARWERATSEISELELHYLEPWIAGLPVNIAAGLQQRQQDSAYVRRSLDGAVTFLWSSDLQLTASVQQTSVIPSEGSTGIARSSTLAGGLELRIDTRDDVYNPREGITLRNSYSGGNKRSSGPAGDVTSAIQRLELDAAYFLELLPRSVLAASLHGRELRGGDLDASDLYRLGGANSLRGYREEQFSGTRLGWSSIELRYSLGRRTFAFAFFDFGYIEQSPDPARHRPAFSALRSGYGIGGRLETGLGIIGVSYALGEGDSIAEGKIHFGLINAF